MKRFSALLALLLLCGCQLGELGRSRALRRTGLELLRGGEREAGRQLLEEALSAAREVSARARFDFRAELARALIDAAAGQQATGHLDRAVERLDEALAFATLAGDEPLGAYALARRALIHLQQGNPELAARDYALSARGFRHTDDRAARAEAVTGQALVVARLGRFDEAAQLHDHARRLAAVSGDAVTLAQTINQAATLAAALGRSEEARRGYTEALVLARRAGDRLQQAFALNNLGLLEGEAGRYAAALAFYEQALDLKRQAGEQSGQAATHANISDLFLLIGQPEDAQAEGRSALQQARLSGDPRLIAQALLRVGELEQREGNLQPAQAAYAEARQLAARVRDGRGVVVAILHDAQLERTRGQNVRARQLFEQAAAAAKEARAGTLALQAWANLCELDLGDPARGAQELDSCQLTARQAERAVDPTLRFQGRRLEALWRLRRGERDLALAALRQATRLLEQTRRQAGTDRFKQGFFGGRIAIFDLLVDLLARSRPAEAFAEAERSRARGLLDLLIEAKVDLTAGAPADAVAREQRALTALAQAQQRAAQASHQDAPAAATALSSAVREVDLARAQLRARSPRAATLAAVEPAGLPEVQAALRPDELLLEYHLAEPRSHLFVVGRSSLAVHELPGKGRLRSSIELFRSLVSLGTSDNQTRADRAALGHQLYQTLVAPAGPSLETARRLIIVPHGAIAHLPFAALLTGPLGSQPEGSPLPYLLRRFELATVPSATILLHLRRTAPSQRARLQGALRLGKDLLGIGNPVLGGIGEDCGRQARPRPVRSRRSRLVAWPPHQRLPPLPFTEVEIAHIARLFPRERADLLVASSATLRSTRAALAGSRHRFVHFATHGIVDAHRPELSGLVLTPEGDDDGFLPLYEIYGLRLQAELVVLSACQTAVGREVAGEGLIGLARGFLHAGAHGVVASLWSVPDESTSVLMAALYRGLARGEGHAAALRQAQLAIVGSERFAAPRDWAAFALIGD